MSVDHYAGAAARWARGATIVYGPIARELVASSPNDLLGRTVLDVGAGTGAASQALADAGAQPLAVDLSFDMLAWRSGRRPPSAVADVCALPLAENSVDDTVSAFVLNHLRQPGAGFCELARVTRPGGALLSCVYGNASRSAVRDVIDQGARRSGWQVPPWYLEVKATATPLLGTAGDMERAARRAGLADITVDERPVDVGVTRAEQLVDYRLGQAMFSPWLDGLGPERTVEVRAELVEEVRPIMEPYRPIVVFLSARKPAANPMSDH